MPTLEALGQLVKKKYPGQYDDMADLELAQKVQAKYPGSYDDFRGSGGAVAQTARKHLANELPKVAAEEQERSDKQAHGQFGATMLKGGGVALATLATGGLGLGGAMAVMGGAGLLSSAAGAGLEEATGTHKSLKERGTEAATDTALALAGEGIGRGIGYAGKTLFPRLLRQAASESANGTRVLEDEYLNTSKQLFDNVRSSGTLPASPSGAPLVDVSAPLKKAYAELKNLPLKNAEIKAAVSDIESHFKDINGQVNSHQPLDELIEVKRKIQQYAWNAPSTSLGRLPRIITKQFAEDLNSSIVETLKQVGPEASALYTKTNEVVKAIKQTTLAERLAKQVITRALTAAVGGRLGYKEGGAGGAIAGAMAGAATPELASLVLKHVATNPAAAALWRNAVSVMEQAPKAGAALAIGTRALKLAGADQTIRDYADFASSSPE